MSDAANVIQFPHAAAGAAAEATSKTCASEAGHWYLPDGTPFYTVPYAGKKKGERKATLTDARKVGAVPSVTTVTKVLAAPGLASWKEKKIFEATVAMHWEPGESMDAVYARVGVEAGKFAGIRADVGTKFHGAMEQYLRGELIKHKQFLPHITAIIAVTKQLGLDLHAGAGATEKSFAHPLGYGGKSDWHSREGDGLVVDFKSKEEIDPGKKYGYEENLMQLAAYRVGLGMPKARGINVFVGESDCAVIVLEWQHADLEAAYEAFLHALAIWKWLKKYNPQTS